MAWRCKGSNSAAAGPTASPPRCRPAHSSCVQGPTCHGTTLISSEFVKTCQSVRSAQLHGSQRLSCTQQALLRWASSLAASAPLLGLLAAAGMFVQ